MLPCGVGEDVGKSFSYDEYQLKDLREAAKGLGVSGWRKMSKSDLIAKLGETDPTGKLVRSKRSAPPAETPPASKKGTVAKPRAAASPKKETSSKKGVIGASSAAKPAPVKKSEPAKKPVPAKKPEKPAAKPTKPVKSAPAKAEKTSASQEKVSAKKNAPAKKEPSAAKTEAAKKTASRSKGSSSRVNVVRSKLRMTPADPIKFTSPEPAEKKSKRRRLPPPKKEDVTKIPMSDTRDRELHDAPVKEPNRTEPVQTGTIYRKTLETPSSGRSGKDRIVLQVCGPFWLHAWWEISANIITRIRAAMGYLWHTADPVLRLYRLRQDAAGGRSTEFVNDFLIHGGIYNWFLNVDDPPGTFFVEIGYRSRDKQFFSLVSSNTVETPQNYIQESMGWSESGWNMLTASTQVSPFESGSIDAEAASSAKNAAASASRRRSGFDLQVDAEVVIKGRTSPDVQLTVRGERIWVREDGSFLIRYHLPERRHVFPVAAVSRDGIDTKTIVLTVERNTKNLETVVRSQLEED